jgi:hypothetical protein
VVFATEQASNCAPGGNLQPTDLAMKIGRKHGLSGKDGQPNSR